MIQQFKILKQISDLFPSILCEFLSFQGEDVSPLHPDLPSGRLDHRGDTIQQSGFSGTAASHNSQELSFRRLERDPVQRLCLISWSSVVFLQSLNFKDYFHFLCLL